MTVNITEIAAPQRLDKMPITPLPNGAPYALASAAVSTTAAGSQAVRAVADGGSFLGFVSTVAGILGSTTVTLTSTNSFRLPANVPEIFAIPPGCKIMVQST